MEGRLPKYFFQEMCSSGGKQTIDKVSAAFIVKNCHPQTSLSKIKVTLFLCLEGIKILGLALQLLAITTLQLQRTKENQDIILRVFKDKLS